MQAAEHDSFAMTLIHLQHRRNALNGMRAEPSHTLKLPLDVATKALV